MFLRYIWKKSVKKKGVVKQIYIPLVFVVGLLLLKSQAYLYSLCFVVGPYERMVAAFTHCRINSCGKDSKAFLIELHYNKDLLFLFLFLFVQLGWTITKIKYNCKTWASRRRELWTIFHVIRRYPCKWQASYEQPL